LFEQDDASRSERDIQAYESTKLSSLAGGVGD
jgi:hypothetical protein